MGNGGISKHAHDNNKQCSLCLADDRESMAMTADAEKHCILFSCI